MVRPLGRVTLLKLVQSRKADPPMKVTLSGMTTVVRLVQPMKAPALMVVTGLPPRVAGILATGVSQRNPVIVTAPPESVYSKEPEVFWAVAVCASRARARVVMKGNLCMCV